MRLGRVQTKILNTLNAYAKKISSGTILALLAISGLLFLVPVTTPAIAANANNPVLTVTGGNPVFGGVGTWITISIANPSANSYAITGFDVLAPTGWSVSDCDYGSYLYLCNYSATGASFFTTNQVTGQGIPPGDSDVVYVYVTPATGTYPSNGVFTTKVQDQSSPGYSTGPNFTIQVIDPATVVSISVTAGGSNTATSYTAGSAVYTVMATVTATNAESGLTINFVDTGTGASSVNYPSSFGSASVTTAGATSTTATASTTF